MSAVFAALCLRLEVQTNPKPGFVSHIDNGAHCDMDAVLLIRTRKHSPLFLPISQRRAP